MFCTRQLRTIMKTSHTEKTGTHWSAHVLYHVPSRRYQRETRHRRLERYEAVNEWRLGHNRLVRNFD